MILWQPQIPYRHSLAADQLIPDMEQAYRYMGYPFHVTPEESIISYASAQLKEQLLVCQPQAVYAYYPCHFLSEDVMDLGFATVTSKHLARHLHGCDGILLFAATIGNQTDRLTRKAGIQNPAYAAIHQGLGAMLIEVYCDHLEQELKKIIETSGAACRSRFSPGYFDFDLCHQKDVFRALSPTIHSIGLTLTDGYLMKPSKSVTAVIGIQSKTYDEE